VADCRFCGQAEIKKDKAGYWHHVGPAAVRIDQDHKAEPVGAAERNGKTKK